MSTVAPPEKSHPSKRFGLLDAGDGLQYQVVRIGYNDRGIKLERIISSMQEMKDDTDIAEASSVAVSLFVLALEPFYSESTVKRLLDSDMLGSEQLRQLVSILRGVDLLGEEKKSLPIEN